MKFLRAATLGTMCVLLFSGCEKVDHVDTQQNLSREDFRDMYNLDPERKGENTNADLNDKALVPPIPDIAPLLAAPRPPKLGNTKLVSIAVTDDVPLRDVIIELSRRADVDVEMDSGIEGGVNFRAKDRPFNEVVERIAAMAGLRYSFKSGVLRVERDLPFVRNYSLDFLNIVRSSTSTVSVSTDISSVGNSSGSGGGGGTSSGGASGGGGSGGGSSGGSGALSTGSSNTITAKAEDDFWAALDVGVRSILASQGPNITSTGVVVANAATPQTATAAGGAVTLPNGEFYVMNRQAGLLSVSATERQHEILAKYLEQLKVGASSQVLIEAKVVEVSLSDAYETGVDWRAIMGPLAFRNGFASPNLNDANSGTFALPDDANGRGGLTDTIRLLNQFGTTRTLSSPRLHAINNQPAVLTFAENRIFFEVQTSAPTVIPTGNSSIVQPGATTTTRQTIPIGLIMTILPSIDVIGNEVTLNVHPTLTRQVDSVIDPGSALAAAQIQAQGGNVPTFTNQIPVVEVRELDSILKMRSGQVMVIGGLMEQGSNNTDTGVPFLSEIPVLGNAFKRVQKENTNRELIIFIRATIVTPQGSYSPADRLVYDKFSKDPRPIAF